MTGVDAFSTYCFLLQEVAHRDEDTWGYYLLEAESQGLNPDYTIADAGKGIRAGQKAAFLEFLEGRQAILKCLLCKHLRAVLSKKIKRC